MVVQEKADYKVLTGDKKKAEMMRGNKSKNISEMPVWLQKAVNSGAEDRVAKLEEKKDQRKLLKMEEVMEKKRKRQDNEVQTGNKHVPLFFCLMLDWPRCGHCTPGEMGGKVNSAMEIYTQKNILIYTIP